MQFAERWLGFGIIGTVIASGLALAALPLRRAPHDAKPTPHVALTSHRCSEPRMPQPPPPPQDDDPYARVFADAQPQLQACFGAETRVELLITIAPDGHVAKVSHRPDPTTPATRCLTNAVEKLRFPTASSTIAIRLPLTSR